MTSQAVSNEAAPAHGGRGTARRTSSVWSHFEYVSGGAGTGGAMATCRRCGSTLRASTKKHGTSHLRRHAKSGFCAKRAAAAGRAAPRLPEAPSAGDGDENWINDLLVEAEFDGAGHLIIEGGVEAAGDNEGRSSNSMPGIYIVGAVVVTLSIMFSSLA
ncbi:hypothetical protein ACQ4PT_016232 [Festuca glaucescens]